MKSNPKTFQLSTNIQQNHKEIIRKQPEVTYQTWLTKILPRVFIKQKMERREGNFNSYLKSKAFSEWRSYGRGRNLPETRVVGEFGEEGRGRWRHKRKMVNLGKFWSVCMWKERGWLRVREKRVIEPQLTSLPSSLRKEKNWTKGKVGILPKTKELHS